MNSENWASPSLKNLSSLSPGVRHHLTKVYTTLAGALLFSVVGVFLHHYLNIGGLLTGLGFMGCAIWLSATPSTRAEETKRLTLLAAASAFQGASLGPLVEIVIKFDSSLLATALVGTSLIFACFSGASLFARQRQYLFLGGILGSLLTCLIWVQLAASIFGGGSLYFNLEVYGGLLLFSGYVLYDTQLIIEKANHGDMDYVKHSLELFMDFIAIFVRVLVILTKNSSERSERQERRKRRQ